MFIKITREKKRKENERTNEQNKQTKTKSTRRRGPWPKILKFVLKSHRFARGRNAQLSSIEIKCVKIPFPSTFFQKKITFVRQENKFTHEKQTKPKNNTNYKTRIQLNRTAHRNPSSHTRYVSSKNCTHEENNYYIYSQSAGATMQFHEYLTPIPGWRQKLS